ncbi:MAG: response regulator [Actinomycetota bacterium]|nr:response regulator [Actinomycetota bacterium]
MNTPSEQSAANVLVVEDEERVRKLVSLGLRRAGYEVVLASDGREALALIAEAKPDLIVSDVTMPNIDGFSLLSTLREDPSTRAIPLIFLTAQGSAEDKVRGLGLGADDYLAKPFDMGELLARVRSKIERPPDLSGQLPRERQASLLSERAFWQEAERELARFQRGGRTGAIAYLSLAELPSLRGELETSQGRAQLTKQVLELIEDDSRPLDLVGRDGEGRFILLLPETKPRVAARWLQHRLQRIAGHLFKITGEHLTFTPVVGFATFAEDLSADELRTQTFAAYEYATAHPDLRPVRFTPKMHQAGQSTKLRPWKQLLPKLRPSPQPGSLPESTSYADSSPSARPERHGGRVLVVDDEERIRKLVSLGLKRAGYDVAVASDGKEALAQIADVRPDLIVSDVMMPNLDGLSLLSSLREDPSTRAIPLILLTARGSIDDLTSGLALGADDYLAKPFDMGELLARVRSKTERPPVPREQLSYDRQTGLLTEQAFWQEAEYELVRYQRGGRPGTLAYLQLVEPLPLRERLDSSGKARLLKEVVELIKADGRPLDLVGRDTEGRFLLLLPETDTKASQRRLDELSRHIADREFLAEERIALTPAVSLVPFSKDSSVDELRMWALAALDYSAWSSHSHSD